QFSTSHFSDAIALSTAAGTAISSANPEKNTIIMMVATGRAQTASVTTVPFNVCPAQKVARSAPLRNVNPLLRLTAPVDEQFQPLG
ncbi:MAG: hypothetical protein ACK4N1_19920, partial [Pseudorhizobium sp.]